MRIGKGIQWSSSKNKEGYAFLAPALIVLLVVIAIPLIFSLIISFTKWNFLNPESTPVFNGIQNFIKTLTDPNDLFSAKITGIFVLASVSAQMIFGIIIALILNRNFKGSRIVTSAIILPFMTAEVVVALCWRYMLQIDYGIINYLLKLIGISPQVWMDQTHALFSIIVIDVWQHTPFVTLIALAALTSVRQELVEAAKVDGASYLQRFFHIVLPSIKPQLLVALIFRTTFAIRVFTQPWVLTGGGPANQTMVLGIDIYRKAFRYYDMGMASSLSWILILVTFVIIFIYLFFFERKDIVK